MTSTTSARLTSGMLRGGLVLALAAMLGWAPAPVAAQATGTLVGTVRDAASQRPLEAVQVYIDEIGMEPTNAFIEVQRDSQSPSPPGREIIGEREIVDLREEYARRMGTHYSMKRFHDTLLTYGPIPFKQIRRLMFEQ